MNAPLRVQWIRHGKVDSHRGDVPATAEGLQQVEAVGRQLRGELEAGEGIYLLHTATRRSRETAYKLYHTLTTQEGDGQQAQFTVLEPAEHQAIRNPDIYVAGIRTEMVSTPEALLEQIPPSGLRAQELLRHPFLRGFWNAPDRIGYWVNHPDPPGEDAAMVARRLFTFAASLLDLPGEAPMRYLCITHSPLIRAFVRHYITGADPGEPNFVESADMLFSTNGTLTLRFRDHVSALSGKSS
jgi:broad specificity phosphatase PhoE